MTLIFLFIVLFNSSVLARKTSIIKTEHRKNQLLNLKVDRAIHKFIDKIALPTAKTSISQPVCPRTFSEETEAKASELKTVLQSSRQSQTCESAGSFREKQGDIQFKEQELNEKNSRVKRNTLCVINDMIEDERSARQDLQPTGINPETICVQQEECVEAGSTDTNTGTINMCKTCKYFVYLPWR